MSGDSAGVQRRPLDLHHTERRVVELLRCGAHMQDVAELEGVVISTIATRLLRARQRNHCATTNQLLYEYGRSLPDERMETMRQPPGAGWRDASHGETETRVA